VRGDAQGTDAAVAHDDSAIADTSMAVRQADFSIAISGRGYRRILVGGHAGAQATPRTDRCAGAVAFSLRSRAV
jgi:hypothetical protein